MARNLSKIFFLPDSFSDRSYSHHLPLSRNGSAQLAKPEFKPHVYSLAPHQALVDLSRYSSVIHVQRLNSLYMCA